MDRYGAVLGWINSETNSLNLGRQTIAGLTERVSKSGAAAKFESLCKSLLDAGDTERARIAGDVGLTAEVAEPYLAADCSTEVELRLVNTGIAPIFNLELRITEYNMDHDIQMLSGKSSVNWVISLPPHSAGPAQLDVFWSGRLLDGKERSASTAVPLEFRHVDAASSNSRPRGNPYKVGTPIDSDDRLYGRDAIISRLINALPQADDPTLLILSGNRRAGKTSILKRLMAPGCVPGWLPIFSDFQGIDSRNAVGSFSANDLFRMLARNVLDAVLQFVLVSDVPRIESIAKSSAPLLFSGADSTGIGPFDSFRSMLVQLHKELRPIRLLLIMDEFEKLQDGIASDTLSPQVLDNFRWLFQHQKGISTILSGSPRIKKLQEEYWAILFGLGVVEPVGALDIPFARLLVSEPANGMLVYSQAAVDEICRLTSRQPYLIQSVCHRVFTLSTERADQAITLEMVGEAAHRFAESSSYFLDLFRTYIRSAHQRFLVFLIDECTKGPDRVTFDLLSTRLEEAGLRYSIMSLKHDLEELRELEVVAFGGENDRTSYRINVPLFSLWLHENEDRDTHLAAAQLE